MLLDLDRSARPSGTPARRARSRATPGRGSPRRVAPRRGPPGRAGGPRGRRSPRSDLADRAAAARPTPSTVERRRATLIGDAGTVARRGAVDSARRGSSPPSATDVARPGPRSAVHEIRALGEGQVGRRQAGMGGSVGSSSPGCRSCLRRRASRRASAGAESSAAAARAHLGLAGARTRRQAPPRLGPRPRAPRRQAVADDRRRAPPARRATTVTSTLPSARSRSRTIARHAHERVSTRTHLPRRSRGATPQAGPRAARARRSPRKRTAKGIDDLLAEPGRHDGRRERAEHEGDERDERQVLHRACPRCSPIGRASACDTARGARMVTNQRWRYHGRSTRSRKTTRLRPQVVTTSQ